MTIVIEEETPRAIPRVMTGILSLDIALSSPISGPGMPMRSGYEIFGRTHVGKSTFGYFLLSVAANGKKASLCDLEGFDREYVISCLKHAGFDGTLKIISDRDEKGIRLHPHMLQEMLDDMKKGAVVGMFDSVGAYQSVVEDDAPIYEMGVGGRAREMSKFARKGASILRGSEEPSIIIFTSHMHDVIGSRIPGVTTTSGGEVLKYLAHTRIKLSQTEVIKIKEEEFAYVIKGKVEKLKHGRKGKEFILVNLSGYGIDKNLSAMFDCFFFDLAVRDKTVNINGKSAGRLSSFVSDALEGRTEKFDVFRELLDKKREILIDLDSGETVGEKGDSVSTQLSDDTPPE